MFYNEHNPPHFHVKYQEYEAIVEIRSGVVTGRLPKRAIMMIFEWLEINKQDLLENWRCIEKRQPLSKIEPLK